MITAVHRNGAAPIRLTPAVKEAGGAALPADLPPPLHHHGMEAEIPKPHWWQKLAARVTDGTRPLRRELERVRAWEPMAQALTTPADFAAKTAEFRRRLAAGETLSSLRDEAYAVAREACRRTLHSPYDEQMLGALAMDQGRVAQMKTGEGKTLTAVMPVYLNALAGRGVHVVTANESLAQRDAEGLSPAYQLLGLRVASCLEAMSPEAKRDAYLADVTYLTNSTLGFDYLRDRSCRDASERVQRAPFFALVDEVDEVLIDEARVPLILSVQSQPAEQEYRAFASLVSELKPEDDFLVDQEKRGVALTETGEDRVANRLGQDRLRAHLERARRMPSSDRSRRLCERAQELLDVSGRIETLIGREQAALSKKLPELAQIQAEKRVLQKQFPGVDVRHPAHAERAAYLQSALEARGLFRRDRDYTVSLPQELEERLTGLCRTLELPADEATMAALLAADLQLDDPEEIRRKTGGDIKSALAAIPAETRREAFQANAELQIVDEFKGRIAEGRRFTAGLHQALEAREGLTVRPEQRSQASITYPNLFKLYPRLAGMSGTARVSAPELADLYSLSVTVIPPHRPSQLAVQPDLLFPTAEAKYRALVQEARDCYEDGIPVLLGTRSVEVNRHLSEMLQQAGVPHQCLNADNVKHNTAKENALLSRAGQSGWVTVATNMSGRGVDIRTDQVNYKRLALAASTLADPNLVSRYFADEQGWPAFLEESGIAPADFADRMARARLSGLANLPVIVQVTSQEESDRVRQWLGETPGVAVQIGDESQVSPLALTLRGQDFPTGGLRVLGSERHSSRRIDEQLVGRSGRQGQPGSARFYLSLEDQLLREASWKGVDSLSGVQAPKLSRAVERCQEKVEQADFSARRSTSQFDGVMNRHRELFYGFRERLVDGQESPEDTVCDWTTKAVLRAARLELDGRVSRDTADYPTAATRTAVDRATRALGLTLDLVCPANATLSSDDLEECLASAVRKAYARARTGLGLPDDQLRDYQRKVLLDAMDGAWMNHLETMEALQGRARMEAHEGEEPLQVYQRLAFDAFDQTVADFQAETAGKVLSDMGKALALHQQLAAAGVSLA